jgi:hypothetical protein
MTIILMTTLFIYQGKLNSYRQGLIDFVFHLLDKNCSGMIEEKELTDYLKQTVQPGIASSGKTLPPEKKSKELIRKIALEGTLNNAISKRDLEEFYIDRGVFTVDDVMFKYEVLDDWLFSEELCDLYLKNEARLTPQRGPESGAVKRGASFLNTELLPYLRKQRSPSMDSTTSNSSHQQIINTLLEGDKEQFIQNRSNLIRSPITTDSNGSAPGSAPGSGPGSRSRSPNIPHRKVSYNEESDTQKQQMMIVQQKLELQAQQLLMQQYQSTAQSPIQPQPSQSSPIQPYTTRPGGRRLREQIETIEESDNEEGEFKIRGKLTSQSNPTPMAGMSEYQIKMELQKEQLQQQQKIMVSVRGEGWVRVRVK